MAAPDTKDRILDTAERLFAEDGVDATSLRAITTSARVNLAAVNYHFGSKEGLIEEVYARRLGPLNRERLARLDAIESEAGAAGPLPLEPILVAFLEPAMRMWASKGAALGVRLLGRTFAGPDGPARTILMKQFREVAGRFHAALGRALPELDGEDLFWRMFFMVGAMAHTMSAADILRTMSGGLCRTDDADAVLRRMVSFVAAGMRSSAPEVPR
jgi:AcrR family transcriptional regulator